MDQRPKFFCENCGTEVRQQDRVCKHCGKFFASVKCPSCGYSGDSRVFRDGCPACGYAVPHDGFTNFQGSRGGKGAFRGRSFNKGHPALGHKKKVGDADPLPWWIYLVSILFLIGLFALIILRR